MGYVTVEDFVAGVDRSRPRYSLPPGTIWTGINGHITRGGDFEKRKAFTTFVDLPTGTLGLERTPTGLIVFGHGTTPASMPASVAYQRLQHPTVGATAMSSLVSSDLYNGKVYAIATFADGNTFHFYDGSEVADWRQQISPYPTGGKGTLARTHQRKLYSPVGSVLWFSGVDDPVLWDIVNDSGAGFQNLSSHQGGSDSIRGLITYQNYLAAFSRAVVQIWDMQADEALNAPFQTINGTGTRSPRSVTGFGDIDAFYLSDSGVRSIRARSGTNLAGVNDVGTPIDTLILEHMRGLTTTQIENAIGVVETVDGRFWLVLGTKIFVFTYFPTKKISAWTWYEPTDSDGNALEFSHVVVYDGRIYGRQGNRIYIYGGADNNTYDSTIATLGLPFLAMSKVGHAKDLKGVDIAATGEWAVDLLVNPNKETEHVLAGDLEGVTYDGAGTGVGAHVHFVAPVLTSKGDGYASVSKVTVYFDGAEPKH
jgi:hypothetical protein